MNKTKLKAWIHAARLRTLPLAVSGVILAGLMAFSEQIYRYDIFSLALITTLLLQILSNLANDYGDFTHGTDNENRVGPERAVQSGLISPKEMKIAIYLTGFMALVTGILLLKVSLGNLFSLTFFVFMLAGIGAIGAAIKYTVGKRNFGYKGFGDIMVFIFFGIASVWGTYYLFTQRLSGWVILPATSVGLLSTGVLNINNMRDVENDKNSGKMTLAVRFGNRVGKIYHALLIVLGLVLFVIYLIELGKFYTVLSLIIPAIPLTVHVSRIIKNNDPKSLDPELKQLSLSTLLISVWVGIGLLL